MTSSQSTIRLRLRGALSLLGVLAAAPAFAQITVSGVADKTVYADNLTFTISMAVGWDYTALLDGVATTVGAPVTVDAVDYHELAVSRTSQSTGATESVLIRFIIRSSERQNSEWGLPPWTPYPRIPSASGEFAGAHLRVVSPRGFPRGIEIPAFAWVEDAGGKRVGVQGALHASEFPDRDLKLFRGVGSTFLPAASAGGALAWTPGIQTLSATKSIAIDAATTWTKVSGAISSSTAWAEDSRIQVTGTLTVAAAATLTIGAGTVVLVDPNVDIEVSGKIVVDGTVDAPVVFTPASRTEPWGGFLFRASTSVAEMKYAIATGGCADHNWFSDHAPDDSTHFGEQALLYMSNGAHVALTDCYFFDCDGQAGHGESSYLTMNRSVYQKFMTGGEYNSGSVNLTGCAVIEFPDEDEPFADDDGDAIYFTGGAHTLTDTLIGWAHDDGTDSGSGAGGTVDVLRGWYESVYHEGMAWSSSGTRIPTAADTVAINCGQGFESAWGTVNATANHCLLTANSTGARFGDNQTSACNGYLHVYDSIILHNYRDVWGRVFSDWEVHVSQMDIRRDYLTEADPLFPENTVWDPAANAALLAPFLPTPAAVVGIGIATRATKFDMDLLPKGVPVRLSTFTASFVSVDYAVSCDAGTIASGNLRFAPGETVKTIELSGPEYAGHAWVDVTLGAAESAELTGIPSIRYVSTAKIVPAGSTWKYLDKGIAAPAGWKTAGFDDSAWKSGPAQLGFGDDGEVTEIEGGPSDARYWTTYFRQVFTASVPFESLVLRVKRDDGAVVSIDGQEVYRTNMPDGDVDYSTSASGAASDDGRSFQTANLSAPATLAAGEHIIAVEVHQSSATSSDLSFDLELIGSPGAISGTRFIRGDANGDLAVDVSDALRILFIEFAGAGSDCLDSADVDDNGVLEVTDAIAVLEYLFLLGEGPMPPFPVAGEDPPPADPLGCDRR
jgi:hypothetical protein